MGRRHRVLPAAVGLTMMFVAVANVRARRTPPKLSDEEIRKIASAIPERADAKPSAKLEPQPALPPPKP